MRFAKLQCFIRTNPEPTRHSHYGIIDIRDDPRLSDALLRMGLLHGLCDHRKAARAAIRKLETPLTAIRGRVCRPRRLQEKGKSGLAEGCRRLSRPCDQDAARRLHDPRKPPCNADAATC